MRIIVFGDLHHKNAKGLDLCKDKIEIIKFDNLNEYKEEEDDYIFCTDSFNLVNNNYKKIIFGPQIDLITIIKFCNTNKEKKIKINLLSEWNKNLTKKFLKGSNVELITLPFPVDINKFKPDIKDERCFIYFKNRHSSILKLAENLLKNYDYKIFIYGNYDENDYLEWISKSKFGIWVGSHESQGFAIQEALSCNCPLFVLNATSLKDECYNDIHYPWKNTNISFDNLEATSASYWDNNCGFVINDYEDIQNNFKKFLQKLNDYSPREYIVNNLARDNFINNLSKEFEIKNIILITSVINPLDVPLSYSNIRSVYNQEERFIQTQNTIRSIKNKIKNCQLIFIECSNMEDQYEKWIENEVNYYINFYSDTEVRNKVFSKSKSLGEGTLTLKALEIILEKKIKFDSLFKISGRFYLNDFFNIEMFNNNLVNYMTNNTRLYKLNYSVVIDFCNYLKSDQVINKFYNCEGYESVFMNLIDSIENKLELKKIGLEGNISVDFYKIDE